VKAVLKEAWSLGDADVAKRRLERLASSLEADHPGAAASVREGLDETLTLQRLGIGGTLYEKLRSTNAIENLNSGIATYSRNVKRWKGGSMVVRWVSAAIVEAEKKFRRVQGWRDIEKLVSVLNDLEAKEEAAAERVAY
jgi:transposase-like protein